MFKFAKSEGIGQKFKDYFFRYLSENDTEVFTTEKKYNEGKTRNIIYLVNETGQFKFLDNEIKDPGRYGLYQYISETFYSVLLKTNKRLNEIYSTWYHIPKNNLLNGHLILKNFQSTEHIDQRGVRLFYCRFGQGYQDLDEILAPREEIELFSRNINNPDNRIFFFGEDQRFRKNFSGRRKNHRISRTKKNCQRFAASVRKKFEII